MPETIDWKDAIHEMRIKTKDKIPFSIEHSTWSTTDDAGHGIKRIERVYLRPMMPKETWKRVDPDLILTYKDLDTEENRHCYKCLITKYNDKQVILS